MIFFIFYPQLLDIYTEFLYNYKNYLQEGGEGMKKIGAEILIGCLKEQGVKTVFGYPGGTVLDIYDALYRDG